MTSYDIIGDIHGRALELRKLLDSLGYECLDGIYRHAQRQVIFLGDFIDRGDREREVISIVRPMVEAGGALAVMGNHEFNAIAYHTPDPAYPGEYLRPRIPKNNHQHAAFLAEYEMRPDEWADVVDWFKTLPLWLDLGDVRVVHACWHEESMSVIADQLGDGNTLTDALIMSSSRKGTSEYNAVEILLKGLEVELPDGRSFSDKDGNERTAIRTRWWLNERSHYRAVAMGPPSMVDQLPDEDFDMSLLPSYPADAPAVFLGHYWMSGDPTPLAQNVVCTDYSVGKIGGKLTAYRWNSGERLSSSSFMSVDRMG